MNAQQYNECMIATRNNLFPDLNDTVNVGGSSITLINVPNDIVQTSTESSNTEK